MKLLMKIWLNANKCEMFNSLLWRKIIQSGRKIIQNKSVCAVFVGFSKITSYRNDLSTFIFK